MHIHFIQHVAFEYPGSIIRWANDHQYPVSFTKIFESTAFPQTDKFDVLVIMGGPMGVYEEATYPWISKEKEFIQASIAGGKKIVGICLGCQLIANVLGAPVFRHIEQEIGWWPVRVLPAHPVTEGLPASFSSFHLHGDTFDLPDGALQLFRTAACQQQGFIYRDQVLGIQFHPEIDETLLKNMIENERDSFTGRGAAQNEETIRKLSGEFMTAQAGYMQGILERFLNFPVTQESVVGK